MCIGASAVRAGAQGAGPNPSAILDQRGVPPSRRIKNLRLALRTCVLLCAACHRSLEQKHRPGPKKALAEFFAVRTAVCEGFEVLGRVRGQCRCDACSGRPR
jgi:hypothetical protein